jgi:NAD(P)-dependent dehydrogenase (short-subunit alcohol dehydrogenase family)
LPVNIRHVEVDLADNSSIRLAVQEIKEMRAMIKLLINAAGVFSPEDNLKSMDGLDLAYAVNFVGPVLLMQVVE